jgi:hypothetical protein
MRNRQYQVWTLKILAVPPFLLEKSQENHKLIAFDELSLPVLKENQKVQLGLCKKFLKFLVLPTFLVLESNPDSPLPSLSQPTSPLHFNFKSQAPLMWTLISLSWGFIDAYRKGLAGEASKGCNIGCIQTEESWSSL